MGNINLESSTPFDQYSRQHIVASVLEILRDNGKPLTVLDVGGYKGRTEDFLLKDKVAVLDLYRIKKKNYTQGNALAMPFEDNSFDYVVSFDVLEHIPAPHRNKFFDECARVARQGVIICAPQKTPSNEYAEKSLNSLYKRLHKIPHQWLREHIQNGLPDFKLLDAYAQDKAFHTASIRSNKTLLWTIMQQAIFVNSKFPLASEYLSGINEFYNQNFKFDGGESQDSAYRVILCCLREKSKIKMLKETLPALAQPIDPRLELQLLEKLADFNVSLVEKTSTLAANYKDLHQHELKRASVLDKDVNRLNSELEKRVTRRLKKGIEARVRKEPAKERKD